MYEKTLKLNDNEVAAKLNLETGEIIEILNQNYSQPNKEVFQPKEVFKKQYLEMSIFLKEVLTPVEYFIVDKLCDMAKPNSNSLEPFSDDTTYLEIAERFNYDRRKIPKLLKKLFELGIYGKFEVVEDIKGLNKYWVLNPFVSFKGKTIDTNLRKLFENTTIVKSYRKYLLSKP